ncbi:prepilin-type N-terminal cleavage/methylation domain-containing protein [Elusimicrobium posterum]|uniref:type IV pilin protein n=1 Tax=Elusimicrobium posterum TaxID=3116653 RepID=UPI003C730764
MKKGFTLIELLVVVLIIGILASIALPQYTKAVEKSRSAEAMIMLKNITDAAQRYYLANGTYAHPSAPIRFEDLDLDFPNIRNLSSSVSKYFVYQIFDGTSTYVEVRAVRSNDGTTAADSQYVAITYKATSDGDLTRKCEDKSSGKICKSLGATTDCEGNICYF